MNCFRLYKYTTEWRFRIEIIHFCQPIRNRSKWIVDRLTILNRIYLNIGCRYLESVCTLYRYTVQYKRFTALGTHIQRIVDAHIGVNEWFECERCTETRTHTQRGTRKVNIKSGLKGLRSVCAYLPFLRLSCSGAWRQLLPLLNTAMTTTNE